MKSNITARQLEIKGVVQGVGFRPFLFGLAQTYSLAGEVSNTADGVDAWVEGREEDIEGFIQDILHKHPLLASISDIQTQKSSLKHFSEFKIVKSKGAPSRNTLISPDVSICKDCLFELENPEDRRFEYPFINCTNCGPRFTIIEDIPYDRPKTSMKSFVMCDQCQKEYDDPMDRRFHAQPNACPDCGPEVFLTDNSGSRVEETAQDAVGLAANFLSQGKILGVKGLGGFHLACDASNELAVQSLREKKIRPHKPFALMAKSVEALHDYVHVSEQEKKLLEAYHRPIVLLEKKKRVFSNLMALAPGVAPLNTCLGVMLPYTPLHYLLLKKGPDILVMTSGNRSGEPLSIDNQDALDAFCHIADYFLLHNRDIYFRADDSIMRIQAGQERFVRRSRGYAPLPVSLNKKLPPVLGCGAGLKNTVCLTRGNDVFISQHIGDLENIKSESYYKSSIEHLKRIFDIQPKIVAHDMHPGYMSTSYADAQNGVKKVAVQHHHAHAVSCMAENNLDEKVIAVTLDGTGYGTDGRIWGGEILLATPKDFLRKAHLSYLHMPGGDKAVLEPWRMAVSVLFSCFGKEFLDLDIPFVRQIGKKKLNIVCQMIEKQLNSPLTSSAGRLFDAVASVLCLRHEISHESQAAMELEAIAAGVGDNELDGPAYDFNIRAGETEGLLEIDMLPCIEQIVKDMQSDLSESVISLKFHHTMVEAFTDAVVRIKKESGIKKAVLSGGVFNNDIVLNQMIARLENKGFEVYTHSKVPTGDGGICLGQVAAAAAMEKD